MAHLADLRASAGEEVSAATASIILAGPALYLAGNRLFKWALWQYAPRSRTVAILALGTLIPLALASSTLVLLGAATGVLGRAVA
jgi:low temperature requirement protein LtrA